MSGRVLSIRAVAGAMALAACTAAGRAQTSSPPATDSFASSGNVQVYEDAQSKACDEHNHSSPEVGGLNAAECYTQPADTRTGNCSTSGNGTLVRKTGATCYYCQNSLYEVMPGAPELVVPQDVATTPQLRGFSCAADEADECYLVCMGTGPFTPPPGTSLVSGNPPLQGKITNQPANKPASLPAESRAPAASNPCLPYGPGGYDYCQNPIGTRLPAGCTCNRAPAPQPAAPGGKGLVRVPPGNPTLAPQTPKFDYADDAATPNIPAFGQAMAKCLNSELPYKVSPTILPVYLTEAQRSASPAVSRVPFAQLSPINQIFVVETAMALQAQSVHDVLYQESQFTPENGTSYMVGWLERCLVAAGLRPMSYDESPNAPWKLYAPFLGVPAGSETAPAETTLPPSGSKGLYRKPAPEPNQLVPSTSAATQYFAMGYTTFGAMKPLPLKPPNP